MIDFALSFDLAICNTLFKKTDSQYSTYKSGGRETQIDFLLCRKTGLKEIMDYKVIYGEHASVQHKIAVLHWDCKSEKRGRPMRKETGIKWWRLKHAARKREFKLKVTRGCESVDG